MANLAALRAAVFPLSAKNLRGEVDIRPLAVRGLKVMGQLLTSEVWSVTRKSYCIFAVHLHQIKLESRSK